MTSIEIYDRISDQNKIQSKHELTSATMLCIDVQKTIALDFFYMFTVTIRNKSK